MFRTPKASNQSSVSQNTRSKNNLEPTQINDLLNQTVITGSKKPSKPDMTGEQQPERPEVPENPPPNPTPPTQPPVQNPPTFDPTQAMMFQMMQSQMQAFQSNMQNMMTMQERSMRAMESRIEKIQNRERISEANSTSSEIGSSSVSVNVSGSDQLRAMIREYQDECLADEDMEKFSLLAILGTLFEKNIISLKCPDGELKKFLKKNEEFGVPDRADAATYRLFLLSWAQDVKLFSHNDGSQSQPFRRGVQVQQQSARSNGSSQQTNRTGTCTRWNTSNCKSQDCPYLHACWYCAEAGDFNQHHRAKNCRFHDSLPAPTIDSRANGIKQERIEQRPRAQTMPTGNNPSVNSALATLGQFLQQPRQQN